MRQSARRQLTLDRSSPCEAPVSTQRALIYARQSMARLNETEQTSLSLDAQIARCTEYAAKSGWEIVHIERDHDLKGADPERPGIQQMLELVQTGGCDVVVVFALARLARDTLLQEILWRKLRDAGVRLVSITEPHSDDDLVRGILAAVNQADRQRMGRYISAAAQQRAARGEHNGCPPYGYRRADQLTYIDKHGRERIRQTGPLVIVEEQAEVIRRVYREFLAGQPLWTIAEGLIADGVPAPKRAWTAHMCKHLLENPAVIGAVKYRNTIATYDGQHDPIIDRETYELVQQRIDDRKVVKHKPSGVRSWCEGLVYHSCGHRMYLYGIHQHNRPGSRTIPSFGCRSAYAQTVNRCGKPRRHIVASKLEAAVRNCLLADLPGIAPLDTAIQRASDASGGDSVQAERQRLEQKRAQAERRYERVREGWLASDRGADWLASETEQFRRDLAAIDDEIARLPAPPDPAVYARIADALASVHETIDTLDGPELRALVEQLGTIRVSGDGVSIAYAPVYRDFLAAPHVQAVPHWR